MLLLIFCGGVISQGISAAAVKDTIKIGVFFESIYDLDFAGYSYATNFWMWSVVQGDVNGDGKIDEADSLASLDRINLIEISNAKEYAFSHQTTSKVISHGATYWWAAQFCKATIYENWNLANYPFDKQKLLLKFESSSYDTTQAIMLHEQDSLTFKKDINLIGWKILRSRIGAKTVTYNSDFGDPNGNGQSSYSRVVFAIELERLEADEYFFKLCLGVFVAFLVSVIVFAISPSSMDSRFGLGIGALFAVAANKYVVDANIPQSATNCLVDKIHELTFVYILITLIASVVSLKLHENQKHKARSSFDTAFGLILLISYVVIIVCFLIVAHQSMAL